MLGALVARLTKKELLEYLCENFLDKIGFSKDAYMLNAPAITPGQIPALS